MGKTRVHPQRWALALGLVLAAGCVGCGNRRGQDAADGTLANAGADAGATGGANGDQQPAAVQPKPVPAAEPVPMGTADLAGYAYSRGPGRAAFKSALAADKAGQWAAVEAACQQALAADPGHLEASWLLALARAQHGRWDQVLDPLSVAVAGDWLRWGERSMAEPALSGFHQSAHGQRYRQLWERYREQFRHAVTTGILVVGRRGKPRYPRHLDSSGGPGRDVQVNHRSEIYAYDRSQQRYLRVSRTNGAAVGYLRTPAGTGLVYVSYRRVGVSASDGPYLRQVRVGAVDLDRGRMIGNEVVFDDVAAIYVTYQPQAAAGAATEARDSAALIPVAHVRPATLAAPSPAPRQRPGSDSKADGNGDNGPDATVDGKAGDRADATVDGKAGDRADATVDGKAGDRADTGNASQAQLRRYALDFVTGAAREITADPVPQAGSTTDGPGIGRETLLVAYDLVTKLRIPVPGVAADWDEVGSAGAFRLAQTRKTITLAPGELADGHTMTWSPTRARLAFATTASDLCAPRQRLDDTASATPTDAVQAKLYVVDAATGRVRQIATGAGGFAPIWLDDSQLVYIDSTGSASAVQIADVVSGAGLVRLDTTGGIGTDRLADLHGCRVRAAAVAPLPPDVPRPQ